MSERGFEAGWTRMAWLCVVVSGCAAAAPTSSKPSPAAQAATPPVGSAEQAKQTVVPETPAPPKRRPAHVRVADGGVYLGGAVVVPMTNVAGDIEMQHRPAGLFLPALASAVSASVKEGKTPGRALVVEIDPRTRYQTVVQVLASLGQSEVESFVLRTPISAELLFQPPRAKDVAFARPGFGPPVLFVSEEGVRVSGESPPPSCGVNGQVPKQGERDNTEALGGCLESLKRGLPTEESATLSAGARVPFERVLAVALVVRGQDGAPRFPRVQFALAR